ncbi:MAG: metalloregulator ArsR/SmtB family transcription factor [Caulobacterales bacterium]
MKDIQEILRALADPTRLAVFEAVAAAEEISVSALVAPGGVSQPAISQHLKCLRDAGLVIERRDGRLALYRALPEGLESLYSWLNHYVKSPERPKKIRTNARRRAP